MTFSLALVLKVMFRDVCIVRRFVKES